MHRKFGSIGRWRFQGCHVVEEIHFFVGCLGRHDDAAEAGCWDGQGQVRLCLHLVPLFRQFNTPFLAFFSLSEHFAKVSKLTLSETLKGIHLYAPIQLYCSKTELGDSDVPFSNKVGDADSLWYANIYYSILSPTYAYNTDIDEYFIFDLVPPISCNWGGWWFKPLNRLMKRKILLHCFTLLQAYRLQCIQVVSCFFCLGSHLYTFYREYTLTWEREREKEECRVSLMPIEGAVYCWRKCLPLGAPYLRPERLPNLRKRLAKRCASLPRFDLLSQLNAKSLKSLGTDCFNLHISFVLRIFFCFSAMIVVTGLRRILTGCNLKMYRNP